MRRGLLATVLAVAAVCLGAGPALAASPAFDYTNPNPGGVQQILAYQESTPKVITGMDATGLTAGVAAEVQVNLWVSTYQGNVAKRLRAVLRDGGTNGAVLQTHNFPQAAVDSTGGHEYQWSFDGTVTPSGTRLTVTIEPYDGYVAVDSYSDNRVFVVHQDAVGGGGSTGGGVSCTTDEPCTVVLPTTTHAALLATCGVLVFCAGAGLITKIGDH